MKKFILKFCLFFFFFGLIIVGVASFAGYDWGNYYFQSKTDYLDNKIEKYNTFFLGSSRVYRHINPEIFDELIIDANSFNMGTPAMYIPEMYYLYKNFIKEYDIKNATIFIELQPYTKLVEVNLKSNRSRYYMNTDSKDFINNYLKHDFIDSSLINEQLLRCNTIAKEHYRLDKTFKSRVNAILSINDKSTSYVGTNGYLSKEKQLELNINSKDLTNIRKKFIKKSRDYNYNHDMITKVNRRYDFGFRIERYNKYHLEELKKIIDQAMKVDNKIIYLLMPNSFQPISLFKQLPSENRIDLANPKKFPELYKKENMFDRGHYNEKGAEYFTKYLAQEYSINFQ